MLFTAGQIGRRLDGTISADRSQEVRDALCNLHRCLEAGGARVTDIVKLTYYKVGHDVSDPWHRAPLLEFLGDHRPPTTLIPVAALAAPGMNFEIEATAVLPQYAEERVDVVVVGAGLSGLRAAVDLHRAGVTVKVIEARDRIGGKTWSQERSEGGVADVGAAWINDSNQSKMFELVQRYGLEVVKQNTDGSIILDQGIGKLKTHPYGQLIGDEEDQKVIDDVIRIRNLFESMCQKIEVKNFVGPALALQADLDSITFEEWVRSNDCCEDAVNALTVATRVLLGVEPSEMSALYFLNYCKSAGGYMLMRCDTEHGGQYLRLANGSQSFSDGLAGELPAGTIVLQSPVRRIEQGVDGVRVISARGVCHAERVIVSVPTPLYHEIQFVPALPAEKLELSRSTKLGDYCKAIVFYETPWWREANLCGLAQSVNGPWAMTRDSSTHGKYSLTCFIVGQPARKWALLDSDRRKTQILEQIQRIYGPFANVQQPVDIVEQIWTNEQWSQGCPCPVMGPGVLTRLGHHLRAPFARLHFVGTETAHEWKGYMEGAVRSGERGAREALAALRHHS